MVAFAGRNRRFFAALRMTSGGGNEPEIPFVSLRAGFRFAQDDNAGGSEPQILRFAQNDIAEREA